MSTQSNNDSNNPALWFWLGALVASPGLLYSISSTLATAAMVIIGVLISIAFLWILITARNLIFYFIIKAFLYAIPCLLIPVIGLSIYHSEVDETLSAEWLVGTIYLGCALSFILAIRSTYKMIQKNIVSNSSGKEVPNI